MTALDNYLWLEATGHWTETPDTPPREVIVSFRNTSLVLSDLKENVLGHWALAGVQAIDRTGDTTVYSMNSDGTETLRIGDPEMNAAIAKVSLGEILPEPTRIQKTRRLSLVGPLVALLIILIIAAVSPGLAPLLATRMVPPASERELGDRMLLALMESSGPICPETPGRRALDSIGTSLAANGEAPRIRVLDLKQTPVLALPGDTILMGSATLKTARAPEEAAGWIALARATDPVADMMRDAGTLQNLRYVFTGNISPRPLESQIAGDWEPPGTAVIQQALNSLHDAGIDQRPLYDALIRYGWQTDPENPVVMQENPRTERLVTDQEWDAVRAICSE